MQQQLTIPLMSVFNAGYISQRTGKPVMQNKPYKVEVPITHIYKYIVGDYAKKETLELRAEKDEDKQKEMKMLTLRYCTPCGTFSYRNSKGLIMPSNILPVDIDDIKDKDTLATLKAKLPDDRRYETALLFTSPRGNGIKWFIDVSRMAEEKPADVFRKVARYVQFEYGVLIDESGKDVARACYLCHDPECYINPKYL